MPSFQRSVAVLPLEPLGGQPISVLVMHGRTAKRNAGN